MSKDPVETPEFESPRIVEFDPNKPAGLIPVQDVSREKLAEAYPGKAQTK